MPDKPLLSLFDPPPARYRAETPWHPLAALLAAVVMFAAALVAGTGLAETAAGRGGPLEAPAGPDVITVHNLVLLGGLQAALVVLILLAASSFGGRPARVLALSPGGLGARVYLAAAGLMFGAVAVSAALVWLFRPDALLADVAPFVRLMRSDLWPLALAVVGLGAPLSEELMFRGFLFSALANSRLGTLGASLVTSGIWTALHAGYSPWGLAEVFFIGLLLSWLLVRTGTLLVPLACHAVYNSVLVLALRVIPVPI